MGSRLGADSGDNESGTNRHVIGCPCHPVVSVNSSQYGFPPSKYSSSPRKYASASNLCFPAADSLFSTSGFESIDGSPSTAGAEALRSTLKFPAMILAGEISRLRTRCLWIDRARSRSAPSRPTG